MILRFTDGVTIDSSGELRVIRLQDGYYVAGQGMLMPVGSYAEGMELIRDMKPGA